MTDQEILNRLAFIKYLYTIGLSQARQTEQNAFVSILSFHDAIDWFMNLACLKMGIDEKSKKDRLPTKKQFIYLMDYFDIIPNLSMRHGVDKINSRRTGLKHHFQIPAKIEVSECETIATLFFEENTKLIFNIVFDSISILDTINNELIREPLKNAVLLIKQNKFEDAAYEIAKSFSELFLIDSHPRTKQPLIKGEIQYGDQMIPNSSFYESSEINSFKRTVQSLIRKYDRNFRIVSETTQVLALGFDYRKYNKVKPLIPSVFKQYDGTYQFGRIHDSSLLTPENLNFAIDYILECSMKLQE